MRTDPLPNPGLYHFRCPYEELDPVELGWRPGPVSPGEAVVWFMAPVGTVWPELDWVRERPRGTPLFVVLPPPEDIVPLGDILRAVPDVGPRAALPAAGRGLKAALRTLLAAPPRSLPVAVADQLHDAGLLPDERSRALVEEILASAPYTHSIEGLARGMCRSRRTLGRFFRDRDLPVPSHWLQFARVLHVAVQIQNSRHNLNRIATRYGFPDGFTMSNTMKRTTGYRPTYVREHLGWEWIVEAWIRREEERAGEDPGAREEEGDDGPPEEMP